jgi:hypothetical protein
MFVLCNVMLLDYRTFFRRLLAEKTRENDSETLDFIISLVFKKMKLATRPSLLLVSGSVLFCFFFYWTFSETKQLIRVYRFVLFRFDFFISSWTLYVPR